MQVKVLLFSVQHPSSAPTPASHVLAPPGAGIPAVERWVGGAVFAFSRWRGTPASFTARFRSERESIANLSRGQPPHVLQQRVLIPRLRGLEDSSRHWSVLMTLDHLRIVNLQITAAIESLTRGRVPEGTVSTAAVKPHPDVGPEVVPTYEASCDGLLALVACHPTLHTKVRYAHPWFGPLDAHGWAAMAAMHMGIHRAQIQRIISGTKRSNL